MWIVFFPWQTRTKGILYEHDWGWVEWCVRKNISMMVCTSITIIYRLHADLLTCVHVDAYVISNTDMYCFLYLCVISHVSYMNIPIQQHKTYQGVWWWWWWCVRACVSESVGERVGGCGVSGCGEWISVCVSEVSGWECVHTCVSGWVGECVGAGCVCRHPLLPGIYPHEYFMN